MICPHTSRTSRWNWHMSSEKMKDCETSSTKPSTSSTSCASMHNSDNPVPSWSPDLQSRIRVCLAEFPRRRMMNIARRVCRNHPEHWEDIVQEGYISLLRAAESWDGRQEFGQYAVKYLRLHMMR